MFIVFFIGREDIWFDDVDIDDIETATGKKFVSDDKKSESITAETTMQTNGFTSRQVKFLQIPILVPISSFLISLILLEIFHVMHFHLKVVLAGKC